MIILGNRSEGFYIPNMGNNDPDNIYEFILQKDDSKEVFLYTLEDISDVSIRHYFEFNPSCLCSGEYTYYLVRTFDWNKKEININDIRESFRKPAKAVLSDVRGFIAANGKLLVTKWTKALLDGEETDQCGNVVDVEPDDTPYGNLIHFVDILNSGKLRYRAGTEHTDPACGNLMLLVEVLNTGKLRYNAEPDFCEDTDYRDQSTHTTYKR